MATASCDDSQYIVIIVGSLLLTIGFGRHDRDRSRCFDVIKDGLAIAEGARDLVNRMSSPKQRCCLQTPKDIYP